MHKITKHVMPVEEVPANTPCSLDPERWFPDEPKPDPYAVAACWGCPFQAGCARRALAEPMPEFGVWGGYRLAPGPGLERSRAQLAIIAGYEMGPAVTPSAEVTAALADLAGWDSPEPHDQPSTAVVASVDDLYGSDDYLSAVDLDDHGQMGLRLDGWGSAAPLETHRRQRSASAPVAVAAARVDVDDHGQIGLDLGGWGSTSTPPATVRRRRVSARRREKCAS